MPQYLYRTTLPNDRRPSELTPAELEIVGAHFAQLKQLTDEGVVILVGRTQNDDPMTFGIAIFEADSDEDAAKLMASDPAIANGVMLGDLFPFKIALQREAM
jgi:uncharacterized protein YciI